MLSRIELGSKTICMKEEGQGNIFDIDSLSLLIGPNGSGKTMILKRLVDYFTGQFTERVNSELKVYKVGNVQMDSAEAVEEWGIIYYSSLPYTPNFQRSQNLIDASPKRKKLSILDELISNRKHIEQFAFDPRLNIMTRINFDKCIGNIMHACVSSKNFSGEIFPGSKIFENIYEDSSRIRLRNSRRAGSSWWKAIEALKSHLLNLPNKNLTIATLIVVDRMIMFSSRVEEAVSYCHRILKIPMNRTGYSKTKFDSFDDVRDVLKVVDASHSRITTVQREDWIEVDLQVDLYSRPSAAFRRVTSVYFETRLDKMSSGEIAILLQFCSLSAALKKIAKKYSKVLLLVDEGDAFLHLEWQRMYIQQLNNLLGTLSGKIGLDALQVLMATHSPLLATDVPKQYVCSLNDGQDGRTPKAFAATLHTLFGQSFNAKTIGEFASEKINEAVENLQAGEGNLKDTLIINCIDNPIIGREIAEILAQKEIVS
ncbi:AAA family ATPase [Pseudomonas sp. FP2338]|uniref:AAA family ATPase n=1 Tax=Pseudomonas sp. FP2338 TaxID=2954093 RepID=UPI0027323E82|nr:AAA family ATPase [Pseudomonas sp. FP2338]WLH87577.1 AAA family ATPase [Pseudomonas sp. FP2338]